MKTSHVHGPDADPNPNTPTNITEPTAGRHYVPPIAIGPIPGLPISEPKPRAPQPTFLEELAAAQAYEEQHPLPSMDDECLMSEGVDPLEVYGGPPKRVPTPRVAWPSSMVAADSDDPAVIWKAICDEAAKPGPTLSPAEADDLWVVYTGRKGKLMVIVCPECDMVPYLDGQFPCPVSISGSSAFTTILHEAQSLAGYARHGAAAAAIGRLARYDQERAKAIKAIRDGEQGRV